MLSCDATQSAHRYGRRFSQRAALERLEPRQLLSTINWDNRGQLSDRFTEVFGADAARARGVIDEAIARWERVITNFNYSDNSNTYTLTVTMRASGTGNGASGGSTDDIDGKPSEGIVTFDRGNDGAGGDWYLDPVPADDVEYDGTIHNAFSATTTGGEPFGQADMLTVAMHEIGHALGLDANAALGKFSTDTGVVDPQGPGGAHYWAFEGPSVSHLFTAWDSGGGGSNQNGPQHTARDFVEVDYNGQTWHGTSDMMNALYPTSRRKTIDNVIAWVIKDAWDYTITVPEAFGTFYSTLNRSTGQLTVRGLPDTPGTSDDNIQIGLFLGALVVSVDIGEDIPGTGPLPGEGDVDAFASVYDPDDVTSIVVLSGDGDDTITINSIGAGIGISVNGGAGDDTLTLGDGDLDTNLSSAISFTGGLGIDALVLDDTTDGAGSDSYTFTATALAKPAGDPISWLTTESVTLNASPNADTITVSATLPSTALRVNGRNGNDTVTVQGTDLFSPVVITTGTGSDVVNINTDNTGIALAIFPATETVTTTNIGAGGRLALAAAVIANANVLVTNTLSIVNGGVLDLTNGSMVLDHGVGSQYNAINALIVSGRNGGAWTGSGITSFAAFAANPQNTTLGILTSTQYFSVYGNGTPFAGQTIDSTAVLVKYTYYGDTDFNGRVDGADYAKLDASFNQQPPNIGGWFNGDLDGNGQIDGADYALIDAAFNSQGAPLRPAAVARVRLGMGALR